MFTKIILIFILLFVSSILLALFGKSIGEKGAQIMACTSTFFTSILSIKLFLNIGKFKVCKNMDLYTWLNIELIDIKFGFYINQVTISMLCIITIISFCAQIYSVEYMSNDPHKIRFFLYLLWFTLFMIILVTSNNTILLFVGWEGVGICSYLLINFWFLRYKANKSSILAVLLNKIGDLSLLISVSLLQYLYKSLSIFFINKSALYLLDIKKIYQENNNILIKSIYKEEYILDLFLQLEYLNINIDFSSNIIELICFFIMIASIGKSAQFGLHLWLPEAMEGPTPVSSLIHAATMVTAGIFLILRTSFLFLHTQTILLTMIFIGSITIIFASSIGLNLYDIKKVIAYSTCSQLGYLFMACGMTIFHISLFHLLMHAFYKALLFLTAGFLIHMSSNNQDLRIIHTAAQSTEFGNVVFLIGSFSISGFAFTSGYYSKEFIIEHLNLLIIRNPEYTTIINIAWLISYITISITAIYSFNSVIIAFYKKVNNVKYIIKNQSSPTIYSIIPLTILSLFSIINGYFFSDKMIGFQTNFWGNSLYIPEIFHSNVDIFIPEIVIPEIVKEIRTLGNSINVYFILLLVVIYLYNSFFLCDGKLSYSKMLKTNIFNVLSIIIEYKYIFLNKYLKNKIIDKIFSKSLSSMLKVFDKGIIEKIGPYGITNFYIKYIKKSYYLQTGYIYHNLGFFIITLVIICYFNELMY